MSELTVRQSIQSTAQGLSIFGNADVTLNDFSILDQTGALDAAPFLIVMVSESFRWRHPMSGPEDEWDITVLLLEPWEKDWPTTLENFAATRQSLRDGFNTGSARAPSGEYVNIGEIRAAGPIFEYTRNDLSYMAQELIFATEEMT